MKMLPGKGIDVAGADDGDGDDNVDEHSELPPSRAWGRRSRKFKNDEGIRFGEKPPVTKDRKTTKIRNDRRKASVPEEVRADVGKSS